MQVTTLTEARALVGRTFERDGERRKFVRVESIRMRIDVLRQRPGFRSVFVWMRFDVVSDWLSKATEVTE